MYDPYGQNLTTNVQTAVPVNVQYPIIYQSPTRQLPTSVQPQAPTTPNQIYQSQVQQPNEYYSKNIYKPQNYNAATYYQTYVPYVSFKIREKSRKLCNFHLFRFKNIAFRHRTMLSIHNNMFNRLLPTQLQIFRDRR